MTKEMLLQTLKKLEDCINDLPEYSQETTFKEVKKIHDKYSVVVGLADDVCNIAHDFYSELGSDYASIFLEKEGNLWVATQDCEDVCNLFEISVDELEEIANTPCED